MIRTTETLGSSGPRGSARSQFQPPSHRAEDVAREIRELDSSAGGGRFQGLGGVAREFLGSLHGGADAFDFEFAGGDLP